MIRVRFAPSPTGKIHVGNGRTALANALVAKREGGSFIIRIEDTDVEREVVDSEKHIFEAFDWLGLKPDESPYHGGNYAPYRTRERAERGDYKKAVEKLMADGRAYECFVSKTELDLMRKIQTSQGQPPHYDNRHRNLSEEEKEAFRKEGREPVIRFKLEEGEIKWDDMVRGEVKFEAKNLGGDPIIVRSNGVPVFSLAGAVDDISQEITHVIRGEDHVTNTAIQVQIFEALGAKVPTMAHMPMLTDTDGGKLSKRIDSLSIAQLKKEGYLPGAINAYMASLGFGTPPELGTLEEIAKRFDLSKMGRSSVRFDVEQLNRVNAMALHNSSFEEVKPYLEGFLPLDEQPEEKLSLFWEVIRENITTLADVKEHYDVYFGSIGDVQIQAEDKEYLSLAKASLPSGEYTPETWNSWVNELKSSSGRKGKALFMPLRLALTGKPHGPEMANVLHLLGEDAAKRRMERAAS